MWPAVGLIRNIFCVSVLVCVLWNRAGVKVSVSVNVCVGEYYYTCDAAVPKIDYRRLALWSKFFLFLLCVAKEDGSAPSSQPKLAVML